MSAQGYEYKTTDVAWLGDVPRHWEVKKLGLTLSEPPCYGVLVPDYAEDGVPMLRITDMENGAADRKYLTTISRNLSAQYSRTIVKSGDVVISVVGTIGETMVIDDNLAGVNLSRAVARLQPGHSVLSEFIVWLIRSAQFNHFTDLISVGTAQRVLNIGDLSAFIAAFPPLDEQATIVAFLDRETAKIDELVDEQSRLIELLKEKRQTVISHAVTKGLDPNAPMKDTGVEWLGQVPEHWRAAVKLAELADKTSHTFVNGPFGSDLLTEELILEGVPVIYIRDLKPEGYIRTSEWCVSEEKAHQLSFCNVTPGDLLVAKVGDPPGLAVIYPDGEQDGIVTQDVIRLRADTNIVEPSFLRYALNSTHGRVR